MGPLRVFNLGVSTLIASKEFCCNSLTVEIIHDNIGVACHSLLQGGLLDLGIESRSPALQADSLRSEPRGKPVLATSLPREVPCFLFCPSRAQASHSLPHQAHLPFIYPQEERSALHSWSSGASPERPLFLSWSPYLLPFLSAPTTLSSSR